MTMDSRVNQKLGNGESQGTEMSVADALNQLDLMQQTSASELNTPASPTHSEQADNGSSGGSLLERVTADIQDMVLGVLKLDVQDFSPTTPLMDYGLDSIASTEIGNLFTNKFNIVIPPTVFFEFQDLSSFVQYLMENHQAELQQLYAKTITAQTKTATIKSHTQVSEASQHTKRQITIQAIDMGKKESSDKGNPQPLVPSTPENVQASVIGETSDHYLLNPHTQANLDHVQDTAGSNQLTSIEHLWQESAALLQTPKSEAIKTQIRQPSREYLQSMRRYTDAANVHLVHRVGKRPLEYASYGEGPPMLMLGGLLMHYSVMWLTNIEALAAKHELIMFHMPGCGELTLHDAMSLHSLADDIAAVLDAHGIREPLPVFGCSFGGVMAQAFVTAYPQRCSALAVAVSTPVAEGATDFQSLMRELQVSPHFMELNRGWPMASLPAYEKVIEGFDFCRALNTLDIPSLVVSGGQDKYTTSAHGKMMAESLRHSQFVEFPDAGHLLTFSHYPEFNALLLDFLADAANPPSSAFETGSHYQQSPDISHTDILQTERNLIKNSTLECATEYVRGGQQGHCIMLSDHSAQAAKALRDLTVKNKLAGVDYRSYFVTCAEEALDAAIRIARHYSRNHSRNQSQGQVLIIERGTKWQNYFDPLKQGETEALVPAIVFTSSLENAQAEYALEQFVAVVLVADQEMTVQDLHHFSSRLQSLPALSVLVDAAFSHPASAQSSWLSIEMQCAFDLIVHGEEIADHQAPVACVLFDKSLSNPWLMTPNEGYVRQPMASLGLTLQLTYQYCRKQFYNELRPESWSQIDALRGDQAAIYQTHCDYGNVGYAKVANIHGFDQRFEQGFGLHTQVVETVPPFNTVTRRDLIDCLSNVGAAPRGQNPQDLISDVFLTHNAETDYWALLEQELFALTGLEACFPASSQNSAIERAISLGLLANSQRKKLLCFAGGAGFSMLSANTAKDPVFDLFRKPFEPLFPHVIFIDPKDANAEMDLVNHLTSGDIAFVWLETLQVEGNAIQALPSNLIRQVNQHKAAGGYLIGVDETQTNLGTGQFLHSKGIVENVDIIALSTSLTDCVFPCGAVLTSTSVLQNAHQKNPESIQSMKQQQANPLAAHLALHSLQKVTDQNLLSNAETMGRYLKSGLQSLANQYPLLKEVRGEGLVLAIEFDLTGYSSFVKQSFGYFLWGAMMRDPVQGILTVVCPVHNHSLRVMPPMTITVGDAEQIIANVKRRLDEGVEQILLGCAEYARQRGDNRTAEFLEDSLRTSPIAMNLDEKRQA